jgi:hypothetical protein
MDSALFNSLVNLTASPASMATIPPPPARSVPAQVQPQAQAAATVPPAPALSAPALPNIGSDLHTVLLQNPQVPLATIAQHTGAPLPAVVSAANDIKAHHQAMTAATVPPLPVQPVNSQIAPTAPAGSTIPPLPSSPTTVPAPTAPTTAPGATTPTGDLPAELQKFQSLAINSNPTSTFSGAAPTPPTFNGVPLSNGATSALYPNGAPPLDTAGQFRPSLESQVANMADAPAVTAASPSAGTTGTTMPPAASAKAQGGNTFLAGLARFAPELLTALAFRGHPANAASAIGGWQQERERQQLAAQQQAQQQFNNQRQLKQDQDVDDNKAATTAGLQERVSEDKFAKVTPALASAQDKGTAQAIYRAQYPNDELGYNKLFEGDPKDPNPLNTIMVANAQGNAQTKADELARTNTLKTLANISDPATAYDTLRAADPSDKWGLSQNFVNPDGTLKSANPYAATLSERTRHDTADESIATAGQTQKQPLINSETARNTADVPLISSEVTKNTADVPLISSEILKNRASVSEIQANTAAIPQRLQDQRDEIGINRDRLAISGDNLGLSEQKWAASPINPQSPAYDPGSATNKTVSKLTAAAVAADTKAHAFSDQAEGKYQQFLTNKWNYLHPTTGAVPTIPFESTPDGQSLLRELDTLHATTNEWNQKTQDLQSQIVKVAKASSRTQNDPGRTGGMSSVPTGFLPVPGHPGAYVSPDKSILAVNGHLYDAKTHKVIQ